jgi:hypothetical protein
MPRQPFPVTIGAAALIEDDHTTGAMELETSGGEPL